jgi:hypothetical protein
MTLYELVFILLFLGSVIALLVCPFLGRKGATAKVLAALASVWGVYLVILAITDLLARQQVFQVGEAQCFDEMCFAVTGLQTMPAQALHATGATSGNFYVVTVRMTSHSRGRAQAEGGLRGRLYDNGAYLNVSAAGQNAYAAQHGESPKLTQKIAPGETIMSVLVFEVPQGMLHPAFTLDHGFTPGYFVIGESPFFHKPDIHELPQELK